MSNVFLICIIYSIATASIAQNTVGTIVNTTEAYEGLTLMSSHTKSYLINNCGQKINSWNSLYLPGNSVYLLPNGNLLRAGRLEDGSSDIVIGGGGGIIELFNWEGIIIWSYVYSTNYFRQHHDIYPMPNGNILLLAATVISAQESIAAGRNPELLTQSRLYNEQIIEIEPIGSNQANIVWEWNVFDHLIQDFDSSKENFGNVASNIEKLDINFLNDRNGAANWLHFNSIQYHEKLDQIVISSRHLSELYIIDHSTTTEQARTDSGGIYGKGGDFLYRWGNPKSYSLGTENDRKLYGQHSPYIIPEGLPNAGEILLYNNGIDHEPFYSEVVTILPPQASPGFYVNTSNMIFGPENFSYKYPGEPDENFYSGILSSAQQLPNGNKLVCEGIKGHFFELNSKDEIVWEYFNPIDNITGTIASQGANPADYNNVNFRVTKYSLDYPAFTGRDLSPGNPIELNSDSNSSCTLSTFEISNKKITLFPNPVIVICYISSKTTVNSIEAFSLLGKSLKKIFNTNQINLSNLNNGVYILKIETEEDFYWNRIIKH